VFTSPALSEIYLHQQRQQLATSAERYARTHAFRTRSRRSLQTKTVRTRRLVLRPLRPVVAS
jgi:hypothetical protein